MFWFCPEQNENALQNAIRNSQKKRATPLGWPLGKVEEG
jgi:hypothetical protein